MIIVGIIIGMIFGLMFAFSIIVFWLYKNDIGKFS